MAKTNKKELVRPDDATDIIALIEKIGKVARGKNDFIKYLKGQKLSWGKLIRAKCYDCMGYYADGKQDCCMPACALYDYMPYAGKGTELTDKE